MVRWKHGKLKPTDGGGQVFMLWLALPAAIGIIRHVSRGSADIRDLIAALLVGTLLWFAIRPFIRDREYTRPRSWYEGGFIAAVWFGFVGVMVFLTGYAPAGHSAHPVPRSVGWNYLAAAAVPFLVAAVALGWEKWGERRSD